MGLFVWRVAAVTSPATRRVVRSTDPAAPTPVGRPGLRASDINLANLIFVLVHPRTA